jgi:ubiquinone/menaquinone biosynthesis C-methylase UbiE
LGHEQIELALGDASSTGLPRSSFDLVHARLVLGNILAREEVVKEMVARCVGSLQRCSAPRVLIGNG